MHLPIFTFFYETPNRPLTESRIEREAERLMDAADSAFLAGKATQAQYDAWTKALNDWANGWYAKVASHV
jgi:hypothetical protein